MKVKKLIITTVVLAVLNSIWGWLTCGWLFNWVYQLEPMNVWVNPEDMSMAMMSFFTLLGAFLFVLVYALINKGISGKTVLTKGMMYGLVAWLVGSLCGIASMSVYTVIADAVIIYWIINSLVTCLWNGVLVTALYGKE